MTTADKLSIAELQRIEREDLAPAPWESLDHWSKSDRAKIALRNAAPVLLEIAAAALELERIKVANDSNLSRWDGKLDAAERRYVAALGKVRS